MFVVKRSWTAFSQSTSRVTCIMAGCSVGHVGHESSQMTHTVTSDLDIIIMIAVIEVTTRTLVVSHQTQVSVMQKITLIKWNNTCNCRLIYSLIATKNKIKTCIRKLFRDCLGATWLNDRMIKHVCQSTVPWQDKEKLISIFVMFWSGYVGYIPASFWAYRTRERT